MSDAYVELIVKRKTPLFDQVKKVVLIVATVMAFLIGLINQLILIVAIVLAVVCYMVIPRFDLEYEYILLNGEMDIDKIMAKSKRKRVISLDLGKMEIVAPADSHYMDSHNNNRNLKIMNFTSMDSGNKAYAMVIATEKDNLKVLFEPNDEMLRMLKKNAPRKVIIE